MDTVHRPSSLPNFNRQREGQDNSNEGGNRRQFQRNERFGQDRCPFWDKVGACRHGAMCVRQHHRPKISKTVVFWKLFPNPIRTYYKRGAGNGNGSNSEPNNGGFFETNDVEIDENKLQKLAGVFYQDLFVELSLKYGEIEDISICGNYNPHLGGNVYVNFKEESSASKCVEDCNDRWFNEKPIFCDFSPVHNLDDASCREFNKILKCERGDQCNLMHVRRPDRETQQKLLASQREHYRNIVSTYHQ